MVREMRAFKGRTKTALAKKRTTTGIFSSYFPSEHLLQNIVKDVTVDIMHVFVCGITRHLILWITDIFIPADFSWSELNASKNASRYARAKHVPDLEPTIGTPRSQKVIHLSGADTLHFAVASIEIIEPLLKRKDHPAWICWKAHVLLLRFVTRDSYSRSSDCSQVKKLVKEYVLAFELVDEWRGFEKPKQHLLDHLSELLDEFGLFKAVWCMHFEHYVQVLKRIFEITNYKAAPMAVCTFWASKSVLHYRDSKRASWLEAEVEPDGDYLLSWAPGSSAHDNSRFLQILVHTQLKDCPIQAARFLRSVRRGGDLVQLHDTVLIRRGDKAWVGRVDEMVQLSQQNIITQRLMTVVRLWITRCKPACLDDGDVCVKVLQTSCALHVTYEDTHVQAVIETEQGDGAFIRYILP